MDKVKINKMMDKLRAEADKHWPAMYGTHQYKHAMLVLSKSDKDVTLSDKDLLRHDLGALCIALGLNHFDLIKDVCS